MLAVSKLLQLTDAFQTVYSVGVKDRMTVNRVLLTNTSSGAKTVQVCFVPPSGTPTAANALLWDYSLNANTYVDIEMSFALSPGYAIRALASAAGAVNILFSGSE